MHGLAEATTSLQVALSMPQPVIRLGERPARCSPESFDSLQIRVTNFGPTIAQRVRFWSPLIALTKQVSVSDEEWEEYDIYNVLEPNTPLTIPSGVQWSWGAELAQIADTAEYRYLHVLMVWQTPNREQRFTYMCHAMQLQYEGELINCQRQFVEKHFTTSTEDSLQMLIDHVHPILSGSIH